MTQEKNGLAGILSTRIEALESQLSVFRGLSFDGAVETCKLVTQELSSIREKLRAELLTRRIIVLGTIHEAQAPGHRLNADLETRLSYLTDKYAVTLIMEEWHESRGRSFTAGLAERWRLAYKNVGTTSDEQYRTYLAPQVNHPAHDGTLPIDENAPSFSEYGPLERQENRETRMVENITAEMQSHKVGLFLVGIAHLHSVTMKLSRNNLGVSAYHWLGHV